MWKRCVVVIGGLVAWWKPLLHLYSIPGYIEDGRSWPGILDSLVADMTWQDWIPSVIGFACFFYALSLHMLPRKLKTLFIRRTTTAPSSRIPSNNVRHPALPPPETSHGMPSTDDPIPAIPCAKIWMAKTEAILLIHSSSLVRLRLPRETITGAELIARAIGVDSKTPGEQLADELTRKLMRDFATQHPTWVRDGKYGKEPLEWWIEEESYRQQSPTIYSERK